MSHPASALVAMPIKGQLSVAIVFHLVYREHVKVLHGFLGRDLRVAKPTVLLSGRAVGRCASRDVRGLAVQDDPLQSVQGVGRRAATELKPSCPGQVRVHHQADERLLRPVETQPTGRRDLDELAPVPGKPGREGRVGR